MLVKYTPDDPHVLWDRVIVGPDCWDWTGQRTVNGYGRISLSHDDELRTHVYAWRLAAGRWPGKGQFVCHTCDNPPCVRNDDAGTYEVDGVLYERWGHLWLGNAVANARDRQLKGRSARGDQHFSRTHPEKLARGDRNGSRLHPESRPRGDQHSSRTRPETLARGDRNASRLYPGLRQGEKNGRAILTVEIVLEIRAICAAKGNLSEFARAHGLGMNTVHKVATGRTWRHV